MKSFALAAAIALLAVVPSHAASGKKAKAPAKTYADTYYYSGIGTTALRDRARPYFGSPVRGIEFFEGVTAHLPSQ